MSPVTRMFWKILIIKWIIYLAFLTVNSAGPLFTYSPNQHAVNTESWASLAQTGLLTVSITLTPTVVANMQIAKNISTFHSA